MSQAVRLNCPVCGAAIATNGHNCAHVQVVYSYDQARFLFLTLDLAEAIARAEAQQLGCPDQEWQSPPELVRSQLMQRHQVILMDCQQRQGSWKGWLIGIDAQAIAPATNVAALYQQEVLVLRS